MRKLGLVILVIGVLLLAGCSQGEQETMIPFEETEPSNVVISSPDVVLPTDPPSDVNWISPGKIEVGNFYSGARAECVLSVHNGNDFPVTFAVDYRHPDSVEEGWAKPTEEVQDWVIIADATPVIAPFETAEILIVLDMPEDAVSPAPLWEFWVSVKDTSQTGMVTVELCSRWLVTMRGG